MKIGIIGTGMIGSSMAALFTGNGYETTVLAVNEELAASGEKNWKGMYQALEEQGLMTEEQTCRCRKKLHFTLTYQDLAEADVIFECAFEDKDVKWSIYKEIEENCGNYKVIISTSSAMSPDTLSPGLKRTPEKLVVAHPFNPPHLVPFVELVGSAVTDREAVQTAYNVLEACGRKVCVMKKSAPGFIANRLQHALLREAIYMVEQGIADPRDIDKALMYSFMPRYTSVGLFEHQDAAGLDMVKNIEDYLLKDLSNASKAPEFICSRVAAGQLGQKTGQGVYTWDEASKEDFKERAAAPYWKYFNWKIPEE